MLDLRQGEPHPRALHAAPANMKPDVLGRK